jgi:hypothetical protein
MSHNNNDVKNSGGKSNMNYRPFRGLGRFLLAACAVGLGVANLGAQTPATPTGANPSRFDAYMGYAYFGAHGSLRPPYTAYSSINEGVIGSGAYYFNKYAGGEIIYTNSPDGRNDGLQDISAGPIVRLPLENFTVFAHGLVGAARLGGPNNDSPSYFFHNAYNWGTELTAGGGMDYNLPFFDNRFSLRLFEVDYKYIHDDFGPYSAPPPSGLGSGGRVNMNAVELSAGLVAHFGHIIPPPPVTYACVAAPATGFPGDPITVTGTALNLNPKKTPTYTWTSDTGPVTSTSTSVSIDTKSLSAGNYTVKGHVTEGPKPGQSADCSAQFAVKAFEPPTISCSASPTSLNPGDSATITASAISPQNRPLTYSYSSSAGTVTGTSSTATLSTAGAAPGSIAVTCNVVDDKGQTASARTSVTIIAPPPPPPPPVPTTSNLCSISFERDTKRPTRVDNEAKACLDDVALSLQRASDAKLALVGNEDSKEMSIKKKKVPVPFAAERAVNTKDYLVTEKGIDPSRIMVYTGSADGKTVTSTLVPVGATLDTAGDTAVDESAVKAVPRTPVKKKK